MRLPILDGQAQPEASTSGRPHEYQGASGPATWRRGRASLHRQAKRQSARLMPVLSSAPTSRNRIKQSLRCAETSSIETQDARLDSPQALQGQGATSALPEHWKHHLQKTKRGDERRVRSYITRVAQTNGLEAEIAALSDKALAAKTAEFKQMLAGGKHMDEILPEAFAVVREASRRILNMRHFDVQLIGGMALHEGNITEMATGEGKTLAATLPAYLNALSGKGVHIVTVNDYLAKRDSEWMGRLYSFLGLSVGIVQEQHSKKRRRAAFRADITYVTSNALGFTYLTDTSTAMSPEELAILRPFNYAIVDEADSVLIDDCMTPLVLSSSSDTVSKERYVLAHKAINSYTENGMLELREQIVNPDSRTVLGTGQYVIDRQSQRVSLTPTGMMIVLRQLVELGHEFAAANRDNRPPTINDLWEDDVPMGPYVVTALRARELHKRDVQYIVRDGDVKIVNSSTGRVLPISRWMDDLHQAIEAQEPGVEIKGVTRAVSSITYQSLFKYYPKLSGMTGTAISAEEEFFEVYNLYVIQIPTHKPSIRIDHPPRVYLSEDAYLDNLYMLVKTAGDEERPVLIGSASIADSEYFSKLLWDWAVPHQMLNARPQYVRREAKVIAQAGVPGVITLATSMAGRGVDVLMGGNPQGLAQMALEQLVFKRYLTGEEWALEYEELPSYFHEFSSDEEMQKELPPQLYGTIRRVQALVNAGLDVDLNSSTVNDLVLGATQTAEKHHQSLIALHVLTAGKRSFEHSWQQMLRLLENAERSTSGREDVKSALMSGAILNGATIRHNFESELARALLALWLYFDLKCADSADHVREKGGLQVLVLAIQESERVDRQLKGRAGRQGDPGETYSLVRVDDPQAKAAGMDGGLQLMQPFFKDYEAEMPYMADGVSQMFIGALRRSREQGRQDARLRLARSDETVEVFRRNKVQLRMQLLTGAMQDRRRILRAAIVDFAQWLVRANIDLAHPPCDPEWNLEAIISQARHVINPPTDEDEHLPMPRSKQMVRLLRDILKIREQSIPLAPARDVLGPDAHSRTAQRLRQALIMRPRDPDLGPVNGVSPALQAELKAQLLVQRQRAELEGSGFTGRWRGGAEALVLHIAAGVVVAYEQLKEGPIMEGFAKWKAYSVLASADADFKPELGSEEEMRERWEKTTMIQVLDDVWAEFLTDVESVKTAVAARAFAQLSPDDEFRLDASDLFLQTLRALRQRWVTRIACGPGLYVDLEVAKEGLKAPPIELDIGPPIHDLREGLEQHQDKEGNKTLAPHMKQPDSNGAAGAYAEDVGRPEQSKEAQDRNSAAAENGQANGHAEAEYEATSIDHAPAKDHTTTGL